MDNRAHRMQQEWLERHRDADALVCDTRTGMCIKAEYISPMKKFQDGVDENARTFFRMVREAEAERERGSTGEKGQ